MTFWVAGAAVVGGIGGALISSNASSNAADAQAGAARDANQTQLQMYNQTRTDNLPALGARNDALARLESLLGVGGDRGASGYSSLGGAINVGDVTKDPGYAFGMQQGQTALGNSFNARGMRDSGAALMAATRYGNDYGTTKYNDAFNRTLQTRNQQLNPLLALAGAGQVGTSQIGQAGAISANNISANQIGAGNAQAANSLAQGNIWGNATNQLAGWYMNQPRGASTQPVGWASGPQSSGWYGDDVYGPQ